MSGLEHVETRPRDFAGQPLPERRGKHAVASAPYDQRGSGDARNARDDGAGVAARLQHGVGALARGGRVELIVIAINFIEGQWKTRREDIVAEVTAKAASTVHLLEEKAAEKRQE